LFETTVKLLKDAIHQFYANGDITGFDVFCDMRNNTDETIALGELHSRVFLFFSKAVFAKDTKLVLDFTIKPTPVHEIPNRITVNKG